MMQRVAALVLLLVGSITAAQADTKLYVEDFTINSGEEKKVAVCLDTDLSDICHVGFTVNLPSGLSFVKDGEKIKMSVESSRAGAAMSIESAWSNGKVIFSDLMRSTAISAGTGAVCYFYVEESGLASSAEITLSSVVLKRQDKSTVSDVVVAGGTVSKNGAVASGITMQFGENEVEFAPGETKNITVSMDNTGKNVQGFQTTLVLPTGWTAAVSSSRGTFTYNDATGKIVNQTGVTGSFGDLLNIALTAPTTFAGSAQVQLTDTKATVDFATVKIDDIAMTVTSSQTVATKPTVAFGGESIVIVPSKTGTIDVNMANNGMTVQGFQATLVLPAGWTAALSSSRGTFTYNDATGKILNYTGVSGEEGAMFTLTLTAPADFEGNAEVKLTNVKATVNNSSLKLDDISLTIYDKDAVAEQALADMKQALDDAKNEIATDYPAAATDEATATALSEAQDIIDALQAEMLEGIFDNVDDQKAALEAKVAEAKSLAAAVQAAADAEAAAQAAAADKLAELKAAAEVLAVSEEAKAYENDKVKAAVAAAEDAIAAANTAVAAVEAEMAKGELATTNKESLAAAVAAAEEAIAAAQEAIAAAEQTYATQKAAAEEAAASKEAYSKLAELKAAAEALAVSDEDQANENEDVKAAVATAIEAITTANTAVAAVEAVIDKGLLATDNKEELAEAIAAAGTAIEAAQTAIDAIKEVVAQAAAAEKLAELKAAAEALAISAEAKAYENADVKAAVAAAEDAIAAANSAVAAVEAEMAKGELATTNKESLAAAVAAAEEAIAAAQTAVAAAEQAYVDQKAADEEAAAQAAAAEKLAELKAAAEALAISDEAKAYENADVKAAVAAAEDAIAAANSAVAAVEAEMAKGELATTNKESLAAAVAAAEEAIAAAQTAVAAAEQAYADQKATDEEAAAAAEAAAQAAAAEKLAELKAAAEALAVSDEAKAYENADVKAAVAAAEDAIAAANTAVAAVETEMAKGELATTNKESLAAAVAAAEEAIAAAQTAVAAAEQAYADKKAVVLPGDVTGTGVVDMDDFYKFAQDLLAGNLPVAGDDNFEVYDANKDGFVDIADLQAILNLSMGLNADGSVPGAARAGGFIFNAGVVQVKSQKMDNGLTRMSIEMNSTVDYRAFVMDVVTSGTLRVVGENAEDITVMSNDLTPNTHRILGYGKINNNGKVINIDLEGNGSVSFQNVNFSSNDAKKVEFEMSGTTAINASLADKTDSNVIFDLGGKVQNGLKKGINILRGNDGSTKKVVK